MKMPTIIIKFFRIVCLIIEFIAVFFILCALHTLATNKVTMGTFLAEVYFISIPVLIVVAIINFLHQYNDYNRFLDFILNLLFAPLSVILHFFSHLFKFSRISKEVVKHPKMYAGSATYRGANEDKQSESRYGSYVQNKTPASRNISNQNSVPSDSRNKYGLSSFLTNVKGSISSKYLSSRKERFFTYEVSHVDASSNGSSLGVKIYIEISVSNEQKKNAEFHFVDNFTIQSEYNDALEALKEDALNIVNAELGSARKKYSDLDNINVIDVKIITRGGF